MEVKGWDGKERGGEGNKGERKKEGRARAGKGWKAEWTGGDEKEREVKGGDGWKGEGERRG